MQTFFPYEIQPLVSDSLDADTKQIPFSKLGNLTALDLYVQAENGATDESATSNRSNYIFQTIKHIDLVGDGVDKILSLDGPALLKYLHWTQGRCPQGKYYGFGDWKTWTKFRIPFGRYYGDKEYTLNSNKYSNLRLDIQYDLARITAVGTSGFKTGTMKFQVVGHQTMPGKSLTSRGCRRVIERKSTQGAASGEDFWDFIPDYPYTGIGLYARKAGSDDENHVTNLKLDLGAGKPILWDYSWRESEEIMNSIKEIDTTFESFVGVKDASDVEMWVGRSKSFRFQHQYDLGTQLYQSTITDVGDEQGDKYHVQQIANHPADLNTWHVTSSYTRQHILARGYCVGSYLHVPLCDGEDWSNPLTPAEISNAKLIWTQGAASTQIYVISEQILPQ